MPPLGAYTRLGSKEVNRENTPARPAVDHVKGASVPYILNGSDTSTIVLTPLEEFIARAKPTHVSHTSAMNRPRGMHVPTHQMRQSPPLLRPPSTISFSLIESLSHFPN
ncbi:hypothetical protein AMTR_s00080p00137230 [Amborella trichopoda]|uniref:Uncharacterized protein n=1 Tax=Amborella trichopoda TaxID=13333 RepID=W1PAI0_AMBTC|nr:hypothetical protein AMTR_s00080p00137230 [Amborella trichopoda]